MKMRLLVISAMQDYQSIIRHSMHVRYLASAKGNILGKGKNAMQDIEVGSYLLLTLFTSGTFEVIAYTYPTSLGRIGNLPQLTCQWCQISKALYISGQLIYSRGSISLHCQRNFSSDLFNPPTYSICLIVSSDRAW